MTWNSSQRSKDDLLRPAQADVLEQTVGDRRRLLHVRDPQALRRARTRDQVQTDYLPLENIQLTFAICRQKSMGSQIELE
jgi:hypothetical protein